MYSVILEESELTFSAACREYGFNPSSFRWWVYHGRTPNKNNLQKFKDAMSDLSNRPKMVRHPSFGWATPEQFERLNGLGIGPERDLLLKQIKEQARRKGKTR